MKALEFPLQTGHDHVAFYYIAGSAGWQNEPNRVTRWSHLATTVL